MIMIYTKPTTPTQATASDRLVYSEETLAQVAKFRKHVEQQEEALEYWQRYSDEWYETMDNLEFEILENSPEHIAQDQLRELESIAFRKEIEAEEQQIRCEELAYFGLDRELTDAEHEVISQSYQEYIKP
jgi:arginine utilization protein RocB